MASIITVSDQGVANALAKFSGNLTNLRPALLAIGEDQVARIKQRFSTATGPDGVRWKANSQTTIIKYITSRGGLSGKTGKVTAKGQALAAGKKPLQGVSGDLARQIFYTAGDNDLTVGASMIYAAMQHFGGTRAAFPHLWGDIPARPFMPVMPSGDLYPEDAGLIVEMMQEYLLG